MAITLMQEQGVAIDDPASDVNEANRKMRKTRSTHLYRAKRELIRAKLARGETSSPTAINRKQPQPLHPEYTMLLRFG